MSWGGWWTEWTEAPPCEDLAGLGNKEILWDSGSGDMLSGGKAWPPSWLLIIPSVVSGLDRQD